ncbi:hypothetical protein MHY85_19385 [Cellulomonas sp. ACRRI]|uniref:hypothetical protein n=1 Tax=Cellulomonas sp. ACRRI TaxID=2918188 RepID=UPI001EF20D2C|nr:hypothetical protein [Cellulomonas sp. ACRRI]MCG7288124.1 hypothetical protein [Cellulomonas sp. ACRRI]
MTAARRRADGTRVLLDAEVHVHYGFLDLLPFGADATEGGLAYAGQANGMCGARRPGALSMRTGTHTGPVPVRVEAHPARPEVPDGWQDVVEVPFVPAGSRYALTAFDSGHELEVPAGVGRARWCADRMDDGYDGARMDDDPVADRYLLQLWPAPPAPEEVVRSSSRRSAYWAGVARDTYPVDLEPARGWTEPTRDEAIRRLREERDRRLREPGLRGAAVTARPRPAPFVGSAGRVHPAHPDSPRGHAPVADPPTGTARASFHLGAWRAREEWLATAFPALAAELDAAPAEAQRAVAAWAARRLAVAAGVLADEDVEALLDAVRDGRAAPAVDRTALTRRLIGDPRRDAPGGAHVGTGPIPAADAPSDARAAALRAVGAAVDLPPGSAVVDAVTALVRQADDRDRTVGDVVDRLRAAARGEVPDEERAGPSAADRERLADERALHVREDADARRAAADRLTWGSARPSDRLRAIPGNTAWLAQHDLGLAERLARASDAAQRALAVAVARRAAGRAGIASDPEIAAALDAAARGRTDAPPDRDALWQRYFPGPVTAAVITFVGSDDPRTPAGRPPSHPVAVALDAVLAAALRDPAAAAVGAVSAVLLTAADPAAEAAAIRRDLDAAGA